MSFLKHDSRSARMQRGSTSIETIFILPVLLLLVFSIAEFGLAFGRYQLVVNAAHEGARIAALNRANCNAGAVATEATNQAQTVVAGLGLSPGDATVTVSGQCVPGNTQVTVEVDHDFPIVSSITGGDIPASIVIAQTAVRATEVPN